MASGFSQLKSDMPPGGGIQEDFRTEKKGLVIKKFSVLMCSIKLAKVMKIVRVNKWCCPKCTELLHARVSDAAIPYACGVLTLVQKLPIYMC